MAPELRPYSALKVELSTLNSDTVLIDGWNVIWFCARSFRLMPLIMKFTVSSRLPAVLNENEPWPRSGAVRNRVLRRRHRAGNQEAEVDEMPPVQRNFLHGPLRNDLAHRHGARVDDRRRPRHADAFRNPAERQPHVDDDRPCHFEIDLAGLILKSGQPNHALSENVQPF